MMATEVVGAILAGGLARRMGGGDKGLIRVGGEPILKHVIGRLKPQVDALILNANGDPARFGDFGLPVSADPVEGYPGPLAGVLAGLEWAAREHEGARFVVTAAGDTPFLPRDLVARLMAAMIAEDAEMAVAASGGRSHPVFALWRVTLAEPLRRAILAEDIRKVDRFTARYRVATAAFADQPIDPFFNINAPEDLVEAERLWAARAGP
jgi:molybdopterin-guanine dinucleotide biosynthesis protein A